MLDAVHGLCHLILNNHMRSELQPRYGGASGGSEMSGDLPDFKHLIN